MKEYYGIIVNGNNKKWGFDLYIDPKYVNDWIEDGIEIYKIENTIPEIINNMGLTRLWCWLQDHNFIPL